MNRRNPFLLASMGLLLAAQAEALTSDHLQCFKVKDDAAKLAYVATLTPTDPTFAAATGCTVKVPAKLLCVDTTKSAVSPAPPGSPDTDPAQTYLCYKTNCPKSSATKTLEDQFGSHGLTVGVTGLLCAPVTPEVDPGCAVAADCPGTDTECSIRTCTATVCGTSFAMTGTTVMSQTSGNCTTNVCDGMGGVATTPDNMDVPAGDGTACTTEMCSAGTPSTQNAPQGTMCADNGGTVCNGMGSCVACNTNGECPASMSLCQTPICTSNTCGMQNAPNGTACNDNGGSNCSAGTCIQTCGNGVVEGAESCDDNNQFSNDGCSSSCVVEPGFNCAGSPSACSAICGDGLILGAEGCDDNGILAGDGCSPTCSVEAGFSCTGQPSACVPI